MTSLGWVPAAFVVWSVMAALPAMAQAPQPQPAQTDQSPATAIEQALMEHACTATLPPPGTIDSEAHEACVRAQLASLRADFGRDLGKLSGSDRRSLDAVCGEVRVDRGREAYLDCLRTQLVALRNRRNRGRAVAPADATVPPLSPGGAPTDAPAAAAVQESQAPVSPGRSYGLWIGVGLVTLVVAAGGVFLAMRARRAPLKCRVCGSAVPVAGELCQKCRHEAADALRRAAAERAEELKAQEEGRRRKIELEEEQRLQRARQEEEEQLRRQQQEEARERENEARRKREEEALRRSQAADVEEEFNPYAVLEVSRDAGKDAIQAAYEQAKQNSDPALVSHLGMEVQEVFKAKALAVERAYQMLTTET